MVPTRKIKASKPDSFSVVGLVRVKARSHCGSGLFLLVSVCAVVWWHGGRAGQGRAGAWGMGGDVVRENCFVTMGVVVS